MKEKLVLVLERESEKKRIEMTFKLGVWGNIKLAKQLKALQNQGWRLMDVEGEGDTAKFLKKVLIEIPQDAPLGMKELGMAMRHTAKVTGIGVSKLESGFKRVAKKVGINE